jgi:hypothetical protein
MSDIELDWELKNKIILYESIYYMLKWNIQ